MRRALGFGLAACLALGGLAHAAGEGREEELARLRRAIQESRERVADYERQQRGLLEAIEALDQSAALLASEVAITERGARRARARLTRIEAEAVERAAQLARTKQAMRVRAVALYQAGNVGTLRLLFAAGGLREFLSRVRALRVLLEHDADLLARHRAESEALALAESRAREQVRVRSEAEQRLRERSRELEAERGEKRNLASRVHADRTSERAALVELEKAARALEETLARLGAEPSPARPPSEGAGFAGLKGRLAPPVQGPVAQAFGRVVDADFGTQTFRSGVVFEAALGTPVLAVAPASVRFAGWFRGYGRLVILDHGDRFFTVSGHLADLAVEVGDAVAAGDAIGTVGDTGSLEGARLYFEIRRGSEPLDPGEWLASAE
ncbi:MAG TPA: peptidoglycan DD-metalloendopeptidase family protein [Myxococcota bacterium]